MVSIFVIDSPKAMRYDSPAGSRARAATVLSKFRRLAALELGVGFLPGRRGVFTES